MRCFWLFLFGALLLAQESSGPVVKTKSADKPYRAAYGDATLWLDPDAWIEKSREAGVVRFLHSSKNVMGWILSDQTPNIPTSGMRRLAVINARRLDPAARVEVEDRRLVNGRDMLYLEIVVNRSGTPIRFAGYYHGGTESNVQAVAYAAEDEFKSCRKEIDEFISGLEVREDSAPDKQ